MSEQEIKVVETMEKYGGSFVKALAQCFYRADRNNINKLKEAFPEYWGQYEEMTTRTKTNHE